MFYNEFSYIEEFMGLVFLFDVDFICSGKGGRIKSEDFDLGIVNIKLYKYFMYFFEGI